MFNLAKELTKKIARMVFGEYSIYYIYASPDKSKNPSQLELKSGHSVQVVDHDAVKSNADPLIRDQINYLGSEALAYAWVSAFIGLVSAARSVISGHSKIGKQNLYKSLLFLGFVAAELQQS